MSLTFLSLIVRDLSFILFGCNSVLRSLEDLHNMANRRLRYHVKEIFKRADCVCFDVDSTLIRDEGIDRLAEACGVGEEVEAL